MTRSGRLMKRDDLSASTGFSGRSLMPRRSLHSAARRHRERENDDDAQDDDNPWGDLDKAFENLADKSLYKQVYLDRPPTSHAEPLSDQSHAKTSSAKDPISEMEEAIFAQAGAAAVKTTSQVPRNVGMGALSGVRFSDAPPSSSTSPGMSAGFGASNVFDLGPAVGSSAKWSEYMQDNSGAEDDSPWSSLDAFVDNPDSSAQFAVPLQLQHQQEVMQLSAQHQYHHHHHHQQQQQHIAQQRQMNSKEAFAANDDLLRQQIELQSQPSAEEAEFARAGAAAVAQLFNAAPPTVDVEDSNRLSHIDPATGSASMVDVSSKLTTSRSATAVGRVYLPHTASQLLRATESQQGISNKGPVLHTAQLAGIMAAKRTADLIPLCHPLPLTHVEVKLEVVDGMDESWIQVECTARTAGQTGVEMEALTGATVACLTVWDMVKAVAGKTMRMGEIMVIKKSGGKSGDWERRI